MWVYRSNHYFTTLCTELGQISHFGCVHKIAHFHFTLPNKQLEYLVVTDLNKYYSDYTHTAFYQYKLLILNLIHNSL